MMGLQLFSFKRAERPPKPAPFKKKAPEYTPAATPDLSDDPLQRAMQLQRYGYVAGQRDRAAENPGYRLLHAAAVKAIDEMFALVPEGFASIPQTVNDDPGCAEADIETNAFLLARHAVTNASFQMFVDGGAYQSLEFWPEDIWPHLIDFKDRTGQAGPRFWRNGRHDVRLAKHPVVGVSYYEALAYTRWAGYRLPTEAEWQMAASWRIRSAAHVLRRYPWGDALDLAHCNIWASGHGQTMPVDACVAGAAPNGIVQLTGNVWEWTDSDFVVSAEEGRTVVGEMLMKSIRGGAFDTYFAWQATSAFRTGMVSLARAHNIGFRCAMDA